ncbi:hypothetical protein [Halorubellus sp. PRR65]|uniref:hypothetical protein n=1 Tax=Halorubellus sp. PRR65 TaxID=3098148 RepID=UPI002B258780|nr:hypothetical protein [Halorubellus sp. PRR65]
MSLSRDAILFGIALVVFGDWLLKYGIDASLLPIAGILLAALGFLGSLEAATSSDDVDERPASDE